MSQVRAPRVEMLNCTRQSTPASTRPSGAMTADWVSTTTRMSRSRAKFGDRVSMTGCTAGATRYPPWTSTAGKPAGPEPGAARQPRSCTVSVPRITRWRTTWATA